MQEIGYFERKERKWKIKKKEMENQGKRCRKKQKVNSETKET